MNAVMDACFRSAKSRAWEPVHLADWRGGKAARIGTGRVPETVDGKVVIKRELRRDGRHKLILKTPRPAIY